jgi:hypothetical protein
VKLELLLKNMEKLSQNLVVVMTLEIIALIISPAINIDSESYYTFWEISVFVINVFSIICLLKYKPEYYLILIFFLLAIPILPIAFLYLILANIRC